MLAYCGLDCSGCPIYLATRVEDPQTQKRTRQDIAVEIKRLYRVTCTAADIADCDGCSTEGGRLFVSCQECGVRKCARDKGMENCDHCREYVCAKLQEFFDCGGKLLHMDAKKKLDAVRVGLRRNGS
jgi:predicted nucleic acid binding AN1-type Zn finger protein